MSSGHRAGADCSVGGEALEQRGAHDLSRRQADRPGSEKLVRIRASGRALLTRHGGGLLGASSPEVRALEGDWGPDVLVVQRWRSRDFALLPIATALAGPFGTALGVQAAFAAAGPFVAALAVIGLGRLDRNELRHPLDVPGDRRPCATGCLTADPPAAP